MTGTRRAMEFRIVIESIVDFVDRVVREELGPFISLRRDLGLNRTTPRSPPFTLISPSNFLPSPMSFVVRQALSVVRIQIHNINTGNLRFFLLRHGLLPGPPGSCHPPLSSEKVCSSPESFKTRYKPNFAVPSRVDFVQDLYLKELKVYKPAPKVPRPAFLPVPQPQNSLVTSYLSLGCQ